MNREILFKAKRKDNGEWVEGYYVYCRKRRYILLIKYKKVGEDHYTVGYSSYYLDYVIDWLNNCFEFCGESKIVVNVGKDTNVPSNDG